MDGKHQVPPQRSKTNLIKGFDKDISQLPLCRNVFHFYISLFNMVSQEVGSHFYVFYSPMKNWIFGLAYGTGAISHKWNSHVGHSVISHGMYYPKNLGAVEATYSTSVVDCATVVCL
jgi:hypothetical protein